MGNEMVLESPFGWTAKKKMRVSDDINLASPFDPFYFSLLFSLFFVFSPSPSPCVLTTPIEDDPTASRDVRNSSQIERRLSPGTVYLVFACVSHAIKQKEVRSMLNTRLNAQRFVIAPRFWNILSLLLPLFSRRNWIFAR